MGVTIKDIAKRCNVSITTVSRVMNNKDQGISQKTRDLILKTVEELQYSPNRLARSMITKKTHTIGLIIPDVRNPFFSELARGVEDVCNAKGYGIFLCNTDGSMEKESEYIRLLKERFTDGILFTTQNTTEYNSIFKEFKNKEYPFCFIERYVDDLPDVPGIFADNFQGAYDITKFIIEKNHSKILFISGPLTTRNAVHRLEGYKQALRDHDLPVDEGLILHGNYRYSGGYKSVSAYLTEKDPDFTALFASNDLMALGAYQALQENGFVIPRDISVAGFDNTPFPEIFQPRLTTVEIPAYKMGEEAAIMILKKINGEELEQPKDVFPLKLIDKGSVIRRK